MSLLCKADLAERQQTTLPPRLCCCTPLVHALLLHGSFSGGDKPGRGAMGDTSDTQWHYIPQQDVRVLTYGRQDPFIRKTSNVGPTPYMGRYKTLEGLENCLGRLSGGTHTHRYPTEDEHPAPRSRRIPFKVLALATYAVTVIPQPAGASTYLITSRNSLRTWTATCTSSLFSKHAYLAKKRLPDLLAKAPRRLPRRFLYTQVAIHLLTVLNLHLSRGAAPAPGE
ncbi:hypothetical protein BDW22DRAFT_1427540 [Trametopsis cervina]|nr:hypothetical protein BDW22DRAFT_1427540 [Trametopsis cervina]